MAGALLNVLDRPSGGRAGVFIFMHFFFHFFLHSQTRSDSSALTGCGHPTAFPANQQLVKAPVDSEKNEKPGLNCAQGPPLLLFTSTQEEHIFVAKVFFSFLRRTRGTFSELIVDSIEILL